jgi:hypothetical protein
MICRQKMALSLTGVLHPCRRRREIPHSVVAGDIFRDYKHAERLVLANGVEKARPCTTAATHARAILSDYGSNVFPPGNRRSSEG